MNRQEMIDIAAIKCEQCEAPITRAETSYEFSVLRQQVSGNGWKLMSYTLVCDNGHRTRIGAKNP